MYRLLQDASPNSAEYEAYSIILRAFDQDQATSPNERVLTIPNDLTKVYLGNLYAHDSAPPEEHAKLREARAIVRKWADDFKRDVGMS